MTPEAAKYIGAAIAVLPLAVIGYSLGKLFSTVTESISRNPSVADRVEKSVMKYFALVEATGLFAFVVAVMILKG